MSEHDFKLNVDSLIERLLEGECNLLSIALHLHIMNFARSDRGARIRERERKTDRETEQHMNEFHSKAVHIFFSHSEFNRWCDRLLSAKEAPGPKCDVCQYGPGVTNGTPGNK